jgi:heat shock protein HslJ
MKKTFLILPLAVLLVNCSSTRNTSATSGTSGNSGAHASASTTNRGMNADASASGSVATPGTGITGTSSSMNSASKSGMSSGSWNKAHTASSGTINWDVYDPNNYMQNPEKYLRPDQMTKAGGWTYNKDWRRNTNFTPEAVGQWQLVLTPEVASAWMPDTRRPETYASFWTPEAVMARYQANMAAIARTQDSIAALNATTEMNTAATANAGKTKSGRAGSAGMIGSPKTTANTTLASGSGTTGTVGTGGTAATIHDSTTVAATSNNVTVPFAMTAVNGNNFMLPMLNMYIDNGSFTAYTGCNSAVGTIVVNGSKLHFDETTPATNVTCIGGFDQTAFMDRLRRADSYDVVDNQFRLKQGDQVLMVFAKTAK